ncbi:polysaccharide deacetylase family protein [Bradymonas sediminis]|uniref:Polysaccharide deacetylase n=1 Tax=Bradymonas sediminis TaxID=1548548 RepID=A0A2Z4FPR8_9DELT|nr:polysaccharide deacetylase family protein [Bradymonas sediminis]AWV90953.1 polysaccharide deacetylase [Bradymonas sediminis]TDP75310.1 polysaccharide deacetylase [Bradymonas sediminis]
MSDSFPAEKPLACLTVDLDSMACYRAIHGLGDGHHRGAPAGGDRAYSVGVRRLLEFFGEAGVPATLFVVGSDTEHPAHAEILGEAAASGHELGNHTYSHFYDLPRRSAATRIDEIARGEAAIERVGGRRPVGYRAPGYNISPEIIETLGRRNYLYDSSMFSCPPYYLAKGAIMGWQKVSGRPSRSAMVAPETLLAPITPYRPSREQMWRQDPLSDLPWEIPMCLVPGVRFPIIGTSLQLMGTTGFDAVFPLLRRAHPRLFQLEFHAIDFMDASDLRGAENADELIAAQPDLRVSWPRKSMIYHHVINRLRADYLFSTLEDAVRHLPG